MKNRDSVLRMIIVSALFGHVVLSAPTANAANTWYFGTVTQIIASNSGDGDFIVYINNQDIKDTCLYDRVQVRIQDIGDARTKMGLAMAMMAQASGKEFGVVVDLPAVGNLCFVSPTSTQGVGIRD